ncbi:MAG TPA: substrate-binding domain-containing protein [Burkholderiales bacterium]|nr:substrate-binding domain-containing protein [Burkholderiales bacterium]
MTNIAAVLMAMTATLLVQTATAAEIKVLSAGAVEPGLKAAAAAFRKESGHEAKITFATAPQLRKRVDGGEVADVVIAPPKVIEEFAKEGKVQPDRVSIGRVGLGVIVRDGAPVPDISNADALKRAVVEADSLVFNRASTGIYFEGLLEKMGIYEQVKSRTTRYADGASVMEHVIRGSGKEIGFGAITEILLYRDKGLRYVGPLPVEVQNYTSYSAVPMMAAPQADIAREFVRYLASPGGRALLVAAGIE